MSELWPQLWLSLRIAAVATVLAGVVGVALAFTMSRKQFRGKSLVEAIILVPLVLPPTVVGYLIIVALGANGWLSPLLGGRSIVFSFAGAVLAAAVVAMPMLYLPAKAGFASVERELEDIAVLMGANRWQLFWHVSMPLATKGLTSGFVLAFARALGEFGATMMVYGIKPDGLTLPISIWLHFDRGTLADAWPAVLSLCAMSLSLVMLYNATSASRQDGGK